MSEDTAPAPGNESKPSDAVQTASVEEALPSSPPEYWLRVHGYPPVPLHSFPSELTKEVIYYHDFYDPYVGRLSSDPRAHLHPGDVLIYYADGGAVIYAVATITGEVEGPIPDPRRGHIWVAPIKREAIIRTVNKAPHAVSLEPPSGWHFLRAVRDFTYIRLPTEDGVYLVEQVRSRASARE